MIHRRPEPSCIHIPFPIVLLLGLMTASPVLADYPADVLSQNPVGYWRLNETTPPPVPQNVATNLGTVGAAGDGVYTNRAIKGAPGAIAGSPADTAARFLALPGVISAGNRVRIPYQPQWNVNGPFSVEFWAKPGQTSETVSPAASTTFLPGPSTRSGWLCYQTSSDFQSGNGWFFRLYSSETDFANRSVFVNMPVNTNTWYHIVGTFDGTNINLYTNGALAASVLFDATYRPATDTNAPMTFGSRSDGAAGFTWFSYIGSVDEPAFYTNALSPAQVLAHYETGTNAAPSTPYDQAILADAPAGYWRLNEPADVLPVAANAGSLGSAADGGYVYDVAPGQNGPQSPGYPGFETTNYSVGLDGSDGYVALPGLNLNTNTITITCWLKRNGDQAGNTGIVVNRAGQTRAGLKFDQSQQELSYNWSDDPATTAFRSYLAIPDAQWVFAALILNPDHAVLALQDGTSFNFTTNFVTHSPELFEAETRIGSDIQTETAFNGEIDEVAIFNRALSLGEVFSQYAGAIGGVGPQIFVETYAVPSVPFEGDRLVLNIDPGGTLPLNFQWRREGTNLPGATLPTYELASTQTNDAGNYDVIISNAYGVVTGQVVTVSVTPVIFPQIIQQPQGRTLFPGGVATFSVGATGGKLVYQWRKDTVNISNATNTSYVISGVASTDAGAYTVVVSNPLGSVTSAPPAVLTVILPAAGSYEESVLNDGPYAWWRLGEPESSTVMVDSLGRHDGVYTGGHTLGVAGVLTGDTAVNFNGGGYGQVPYASALNGDTFTIEVWARAPASQSGFNRGVLSSFSSAAPGGGRGIGFTKADSDFWRGLNGKNDGQLYYYNDIGDFVPDRWTHIAATVSFGTLTWHFNGNLRFGAFAGAIVKNLSAPFVIGAFQPGGALNLRWVGEIDEVIYYPTALTSNQITAHYIAALYGTNTAPLFTQQPASQTVIEGGTATFSAVAEGSVPITLQWNRNGSPIAGATNSTLTLSNVTYADQAAFTLTAINPVGSSNSAPAVLSVAPPPQCSNLTNELVLHLRFDGDYTDSSGRTNDGSAVGAVTFVPGMLGQAMHYKTDTANLIYNYVTVGLRDDLQFSSNINFSVSYWVRTPTNAITGDLPFICSSQYSFSDDGITFAPTYNGSGWSWSLNQVGVYGGPSINDGQWHHLVHTFDRNGYAVTYVDGVFRDSRPSGGQGTDVDTGAPLNIGQSAWGMYPESGEADIDDIGIWRRALGSYEAQSIYYAGKNGGSFDACDTLSIEIRKAGADIELIWQTGDLLRSDSVLGPWTPVPAATPPYLKFTPDSTNQFYRVQLME